MMDQRNKSPSHFEDNKRHVESLSSLNKDLHSAKKNLFIQEFQLDDQVNNKNAAAHETQGPGGNNRIITLTAENMDAQMQETPT